MLDLMGTHIGFAHIGFLYEFYDDSLIIRTVSVVHGSHVENLDRYGCPWTLHPLFKIWTDSAAHGSLHSL